jgi:hypothetical protein
MGLWHDRSGYGPVGERSLWGDFRSQNRRAEQAAPTNRFALLEKNLYEEPMIQPERMSPAAGFAVACGIGVLTFVLLQAAGIEWIIVLPLPVLAL